MPCGNFQKDPAVAGKLLLRVRCILCLIIFNQFVFLILVLSIHVYTDEICGHWLVRAVEVMHEVDSEKKIT